MGPETPRSAQLDRWRELGPEGRVELGCSLISLGLELGNEPEGAQETPNTEA